MCLLLTNISPIFYIFIGDKNFIKIKCDKYLSLIFYFILQQLQIFVPCFLIFIIDKYLSNVFLIFINDKYLSRVSFCMSDY